MKKIHIPHIKIALKLILSILVIFPAAMCMTTNETPNRQTIEQALHEIETIKLPEIERLFALCAKRGITVDYEMIDYTVIKDFTGYVRDDMNHRNMTRAVYGLKCLEEACERILSSLNAYLAGQKQPWEITRYVTGRVEIQGGSLIGKAVNSVTGEEKMRPLFFTGYGHFDQIIQDIPKMTAYGVDILQTEIGPWTVVTGPDSINTAAIEKIENILREAEKNNIRVDVLLAPHYFPQWALQQYPHLHENTGYFLTYNMYEPEAKRIIQTHITEVMKRIKDYTSLNSVCLSNEPVFSTAKNFRLNRRDAAVNVMWRQYLEETHGTIEALNNVYKTMYRSFDTVSMPREIEATPQFYDWVVFNDTVFAGWHEWMAEIVREIAPNVPVHSKIMPASISPAGAKNALTWGIDPERFAAFSQLNGNDANNYLFNNHDNITEKMKWYDFLMSMKKMPIYNSEDHIIADRSQNYIPEQAMHVRADMWQGAVHGRSATTIWVWERTHERNSDFAGSVLHRPDAVSVIGKTNLDLNRLAHEVTALQNAPARTAILYSNPAKVYDETYFHTIDKVYKGIVYNGGKAGFITERQLTANEFGNYKIIIIPAAVHIMPETLGAIREFIENGGKVLVIGENALSRDHYNRAITGPDRNFIMENSVILKDAAIAELEIWNAVRGILHESGLYKVRLLDNNTGKPVHGAAWLSAEYNSKLLINICNYEWGGSKSTAVFVDGKPAGTVTELISGNTIDGGNMKLSPYTPVLISVDLRLLETN